jgi:hypothetical protein
MSETGPDHHQHGSEEEPSHLPEGFTASDHEFGGPYIFVTRDLLVRNEDRPRLLAVLQDRGFEPHVREVGRGLSWLMLPDAPQDDQFVPELVSRLRAQEEDPIAVSPNHVLGWVSHSIPITATPPEPAPPLPPIEACEGRGGEGVTVAVLDGGMPERIPDWFDGAAVPLDPGGADVEPPSADGAPLIDPAGHGVFVAGLVHRFAPGATVLYHRVLDQNGFVTDVQLAEELRRVGRIPEVQVINLSLGGHTHDAVAGLPATAEALEELRIHRPDLVVVAGAGNEGVERPFYPAAYKGVIGVAAVGADGRRACFSNYGSWVDCAAAGVDVTSTFLTVRDVTVQSYYHPNCLGRDDPGLKPFSFDGWASMSGTSAAAPVVSGLIATKMTEAEVDARTAADALIDAIGQPRLPGIGVVLPAGQSD